MTTTAAYRRHDISDRAWETLEPLLPGGPGKVGRPAQNNRRFINGVFWVLRTGAPWRDLPPDYGHWGSTYNRFRNWQKDGTWQRLLDTLANDPDLEWLMIDGSYVKCISTAQGRWEAIRRWDAPKGADCQTPLGGGRPRNVGSDAGHGGNGGRLRPGGGVAGRHCGGAFAGGSRL